MFFVYAFYEIGILMGEHGEIYSGHSHTKIKVGGKTEFRSKVSVQLPHHQGNEQSFQARVARVTAIRNILSPTTLVQTPFNLVQAPLARTTIMMDPRYN